MKTKTGIKLKFGDVIINHWAGPNNPNRKSMVLSIGKHINCIHKDGKITQLINDKQTLITVLGNCFDSLTFDELNMPYEESNKITNQWRKDNPNYWG